MTMCLRILKILRSPAVQRSFILLRSPFLTEIYLICKFSFINQNISKPAIEHSTLFKDVTLAQIALTQFWIAKFYLVINLMANRVMLMFSEMLQESEAILFILNVCHMS